MQTNKLSSLQLELLKVYSFEPEKNEMEEIKTFLGTLFANRLLKKINKKIDEKNISIETLENWLNEKS
jgi:hypothetical protein